MKTMALCVTALLAGCVSVGDIRAKPPVYEGNTSKPLNTVAACIAAALQNGPGVLVSTVPLADGTSIIQSAHVPQGITPFVIVDLREAAGSIAVAIRANGRTPRDPAKNFAPVIRCL